MSVGVLLNTLRDISRVDCPCICCRNNAAMAERGIEAYRQDESRKTLNPAEVQLVDAAENRELFHHSV